MINKPLEDYTTQDLLNILNETVDAIIIVDSKTNKYRSIVKKGIFEQLFGETGEYHDLIKKLWFHLENSSEEITSDYKNFVSYYGEFKGKYSRRLKLFLEGSDTPHIVQMNVYPFNGSGKYVFALDELADDEYVEEYMTRRKVSAIQNTFLFSMIVDLNADTTNSISVTEISDDTVNSSIAYSQWRLMIVNMIHPKDKDLFLQFSNPDYLKNNLGMGSQTSFDCLMKNLEGEFIWVKLIFSRAHTASEADFRFVFMVQDINDSTLELMDTLKKYETLAHKDSLTGLLNRAGIETEINADISDFNNDKEPVSLLMIDLDNFKTVNDTYGHSVGDNTLKIFAQILETCTKSQRIYVGRWGGEEFVVLIRDCSQEEALELAESIRKMVEEKDFGKAGHITCSLGVSSLKAGDSFEDIFNRIDKAMYSSKESGRNRVTVN